MLRSWAFPAAHTPKRGRRSFRRYSTSSISIRRKRSKSRGGRNHKKHKRLNSVPLVLLVVSPLRVLLTSYFEAGDSDAAFVHRTTAYLPRLHAGSSLQRRQFLRQ